MKYFQIFKKILPWLSLGVLVVFFDPHSHKELAEKGWLLLIIVMMMRPLAQLFPRIGFLRYLVMLRKELGIIAGSLLLGHGLGFFLQMGINPLAIFTDGNYWNFKEMMSWGLVGAIVCIPLVATSNMFSMKLLGKKWKWIQRLSYVLFISGGIHVILVKPSEMIGPIIMMTLWAILWILAYFGVVIWKKKQ